MPGSRNEKLYSLCKSVAYAAGQSWCILESPRTTVAAVFYSAAFVRKLCGPDQQRAVKRQYRRIAELVNWATIAIHWVGSKSILVAPACMVLGRLLACL